MPSRSPLLSASLLLALACGKNPTQNQHPSLLLSAIAAGYYATCGIGLDGEGYCWGNGRFGQLGFQAVEDCSSIPGEDPCATTARRVAGSHTFGAIAAGGAHMCALTVAGQAFCWGDDQFGQLGTLDTAALCGPGTAPCAREPVPVFLGGPLTSLSGGDSHTCAVQQTGTAYCWGYGSSGQLGNGATSNSEAPDSVRGVTLTAIAAGGASTCGIAADSTVYCWGLNHLGQLGDSTTAGQSLPQHIASTERFVQISVGTAHACGVTSHATALCWGSDIDGELGSASPPASCNGVPCSRVPVPVQGGIEFRTVIAGETYTCGLSSATSYCWGKIPGTSGPGSSMPAPFGTLGSGGGEPFVVLSASIDHACGITAAREAYCWGSDYNGMLGDGPADGSGSRPVLVIAPDSSAAGH